MPLMSPAKLLKRALTLATGRILALPVAVLMPHSRCNCRCLMCDIWKANEIKQELTVEELRPVVAALARLGTRRVVLSGGEPLLHANLWGLCRLLDEHAIRITLLSTGLTLEQHARDVARWCNEVIVSVDGDAQIHDRIRGLEGAFDRLVGGVRAVLREAPECRVTGRCVIQRLNCRHLISVIEAAHEIPLTRISFLGADVTSPAFNRPVGWSRERIAEVALDAAEVTELERSIETAVAVSGRDFESGFIAESPAKLRRIARHYRTLCGARAPDPPECNAPWVSTVIEADGTVRPCFFHPPLGNIRQAPLEQILNGELAVKFRHQLDVGRDPVCRNCTCTLRLAPWHAGG